MMETREPGPLTDSIQEYRLRTFDNKVFMITFRDKKEGATGGWRKLHNEELHNLYTSPNIMRWEGHVAQTG
jgi:hypothetical protein